MPRIRINEKKLNEILNESIKKDPSIKEDLEILDKAYQEAKKAGLDKMSMDEIDEMIKSVREEIKEEGRSKKRSES